MIVALTSRRARGALAVLALALAASASAPARAAVPAITTPVTDLAGVLDADAEAAVEERLVALRAATGVQMAVLTVTSTDGRAIDDYAQDVFTRWGGGSATRNDGALFVLAVGDRRNRLHLGYGLEPSLSDADTYTLLAALRPALQRGDHAGACRDIVDAVARALVHVTPEAPIGPAPLPWPQRPGVFFAVIALGWLAGINFIWPLGTLGPAAASRRRKRRQQRAAPLSPWRVFLRKHRALLTWLLPPLLLALGMGLASDLGFAVGYALAWLAAAGVGCVSGLALREGPVRRWVYLAFMGALVAFIGSMLVRWTSLEAPGLRLDDGFAVALVAGVGGALLALFSAFFVPGFGQGSSGSYRSSSSSESSSWSSSSSSSSSYASSSSSSSPSSPSWSGGGGSSGGGGASSSW